MSTEQSQTSAPETAVAEETSVLDSILAKVDVAAPEPGVTVEEFDDPAANADKPKGALLAASLRVFLDAVTAMDAPVEAVDKTLIDGLVAQIDAKISEQLDEILHHEQFQKLESAWTALKFLVDRTDFRKNARVEILDVSKDALRESFEDAPELTQSALYRHVYTNAYDQPGQHPYSVMVSNYEFDKNAPDIALLTDVSKVASAALCPFLGAIGPDFFGKGSMADWKRIPDLSAHLSTVDYAKWNAFRDSPDSRYVGLTFPRFMLRLPYGPDTVPVKSFTYREDVTGEDHEKYLWGNAAFAMAANLATSFARDGWCVQIRGPQSGGKVENLPVHLYDVGRGREMKIPTEVPISETLEFEASNLGFIPLSVYEGTDYACFFSANSAQKPVLYDDDAATANSRINARLPYIFLGSRLGHYLKVRQREHIGKATDAETVEQELNAWLRKLTTKMPNPNQDQIAKYPLKEGRVHVYDLPDNPGFFRVEMALMPHFQIEGMDINLSMVSKMPKQK